MALVLAGEHPGRDYRGHSGGAAHPPKPSRRRPALRHSRRYHRDPGLVSMVYGFTKATESWTSPETLFFIGASIVLLAAFFIIEAKTSHPLLLLRVILDRNRGGSFITSLLVGVSMFGMFLFLTFCTGARCSTPAEVGLRVSAVQRWPVLSVLPGLATAAAVWGHAQSWRQVCSWAPPGMLWLTQFGVDKAYPRMSCLRRSCLSVGMGLTFVPLSSTARDGSRSTMRVSRRRPSTRTQQIGGSLKDGALLNTIAASANDCIRVG